jgi:hypothetical protein
VKLPQVVKPLESGGGLVVRIRSTVVAAAATVIIVATRRIGAAVLIILLLDKAKASEHDNAAVHERQHMFVTSNGRLAVFTDRKLLPGSDATGTESEEPHVGEVAGIWVHTTIHVKE